MEMALGRQGSFNGLPIAGFASIDRAKASQTMKPLTYAQSRTVVPFPAALREQTAGLRRDEAPSSQEPVLLSNDYQCAPCHRIQPYRAAREAQDLDPQPSAASASDEFLNFENFLKIEKLQRILKATQLRLRACERALCGAHARAEALQDRLAEVEGRGPAVIKRTSSAARIARKFLAISSSVRRFIARSG
jgi:hypothetical protein